MPGTTTGNGSQPNEPAAPAAPPIVAPYQDEQPPAPANPPSALVTLGSPVPGVNPPPIDTNAFNIDVFGTGPANAPVFDPTHPGSLPGSSQTSNPPSSLAPGNIGSGFPSAADEPERAGVGTSTTHQTRDTRNSSDIDLPSNAGVGRAQNSSDMDLPAGTAPRADTRNSSDIDLPSNAGVGRAQNSSDMDLPSNTRPADCGSCTSLPSNPGIPDAVPSVPSTVAAAQSAAETSQTVSAPSFTSLGTSTSQSTNAQGSFSLTADTGFATQVTIGTETYSLGANGWEDVNGNPVTPDTAPGLSDALQGQADVTGLPQTGFDGTEFTPNASVTEAGVPTDADYAAAGIDSRNPGDAQVGNTPSAPSTSETPQSEQARDNNDRSDGGASSGPPAGGDDQGNGGQPAADSGNMSASADQNNGGDNQGNSNSNGSDNGNGN